MHNVLIVDDEPGIRESLAGVLADEGYSAASVESGEASLDLLRKTVFEVVLIDIWLPGMDGLERLEKIRDLDNPPEVIMISGHGTIETAVRATKLGAFDFLEKPLSLDKTLILVKNAIESKKLQRENVDLKKQLHSKSVIVGDSIPMKALRQQIGLMAPTNGRVLIYGESGTGKELVAHAIYAQSLRKDETFVEMNCAAIPEDLIESELFGQRIYDHSRRSCDCFDQQGSGGGNLKRQLPGRSFLPAECDSLLCPTASGTQGRCSAVCAVLPQGTGRYLRATAARDYRRGHR